MSSKNRTTFAKLNRETKLLERRIAKQARKDARKLAAADEATRPPEEFEQPEQDTEDEDRSVAP